ncbi:hypothetical protein YC2023_077785 [Brassica napus]
MSAFYCNETAEKGNCVTSLASQFSEEEARKAASYFEHKTGEKWEEMNHLQRFFEENDSPVKKLHDQRPAFK